MDYFIRNRFLRIKMYRRRLLREVGFSYCLFLSYIFIKFVSLQKFDFIIKRKEWFETISLAALLFSSVIFMNAVKIIIKGCWTFYTSEDNDLRQDE